MGNKKEMVVVILVKVAFCCHMPLTLLKKSKEVLENLC